MSFDKLKKIERNYVRWYPIDLKNITAQEIFEPKKKGIYIHIPFCKQKCAYCRYNTIIEKDLPDDNYVKRYLNAIYKEIDFYANMPRFGNYTIETLYIGGGTPSFLKTEDLVRLIKYVTNRFSFLKNAEICIEANPTSADINKLQALYETGVNRISIGVQSFDDRILKVIERNTSSEENIQAIKLLKSVGYKNINADLIYRIPSQTLPEIINSIQMATDLGVNHISLYPLWVRPNTTFNEKILQQDLHLPELDLEIQMLEESTQLLKKNGYYQYNVFDFVDKKSNRCINTLYQWEDGEWIGIGPGSTSYFEGAFYINTYDIDQYMGMAAMGSPTMQVGIKLSQRDRMERSMIFGLRMFPFEKQRFYNQYGVNAEDVFKEQLELLLKNKLIEINAQNINLTFEGILNVNGISKLFYSDSRKGKLQPIGVDSSGNLMVEDDL
jgi:oxygen-independent coproporphyrinogen-3 oxidase